MKARQIVEWARRLAEWGRRLVEWARPFVERTWRFVKDSAVAVGKAVWNFLVQVARGVWFLILLLSSVLYHVLLFVLVVLPIALPISVVVGLFMQWDAFIDRIHHIGQETPIVQTLVFILVGAGVLGGIVMKIVEAAYEALIELGKAPVEVIRKFWSRGFAFEAPPFGPWCASVAEIASTTWSTVMIALRFAGALLAGVLLIATAYPLFARPVQTVDRYVTVVDAKDTDTGTWQEIRLYMSTSAVFSLAHVEDADPTTGEGICLGEPQRKWLDEFRKAIGNCMREAKPTDEAPKPVFKVTGYASIAPMHVKGDTKASPRLNCKVANWRAAAVGDYLINPTKERANTRWRCAHVEGTFNQNAPDDTHQCGRHYGAPNQEGNPFHVKVHQWTTPSQMAKGKPADDGARPNDRRFDVEILNRVVHIEVPKDFCRATPAKLPAP